MDEIMQKLAQYPPEERLQIVEQAFADKERLDKLQSYAGNRRITIDIQTDDARAAIDQVLEAAEQE
jgi:hypothetical protein